MTTSAAPAAPAAPATSTPTTTSSDLASLTATNERYTRFSGYVPPDTLRSTTLTIIGCGSVGAQLALLAASSGIGTLNLIDPDLISEVNLGCQPWPEHSIGTSKTETLATLCRDRNLHVYTQSYPRPALPSDVAPCYDYDIVIFCVDNIEVRSSLFSSWREGITHTPNPPRTCLIDTRMALLSGHILCARADDPSSLDAYFSTLFPKSEALEAPCTARSTVFAATTLASHALACAFAHLVSLSNPAALPPSHPSAYRNYQFTLGPIPTLTRD